MSFDAFKNAFTQISIGYYHPDSLSDFYTGKRSFRMTAKKDTKVTIDVSKPSPRGLDDEAEKSKLKNMQVTVMFAGASDPKKSSSQQDPFTLYSRNTISVEWSFYLDAGKTYFFFVDSDESIMPDITTTFYYQ